MLTLQSGNAGAFIGTNVFLKREEPRFHTGFSVGLGLCVMGMVAACVFYSGMWMGNRRKDAKIDIAGVNREGEHGYAIDGEGERESVIRYSL